MPEQKTLPEEYKETAKFWNMAWDEDLFESLPKKVQAELYDFERMISTWSKVTYAISGGKLSKPNYTADVLITEYEDYVSEQIQEGVEEELSQAVQKAKQDIQTDLMRILTPLKERDGSLTQGITTTDLIKYFEKETLTKE